MKACLKLLSAVALALVLLEGSSRAEFLYVANGGSVSAYGIGPNGALTPVPGSPFPAVNGAVAVAVDPWGRFVYVTGNNSISAYHVAGNGALTPVPGSPFPVATGYVFSAMAARS